MSHEDYKRGYEDAKELYSEPWYLRWAPSVFSLLIFVLLFGGFQCSWRHG